MVFTSILTMKAAGFSEKLVSLYQTTWPCVSEYRSFNIHGYENLTFHYSCWFHLPRHKNRGALRTCEVKCFWVFRKVTVT